MRSLSSSLCAVGCCAELVSLRCAARVVCAVSGAWCCGALLCVVRLPLVCCCGVLGLVACSYLLVAFQAGSDLRGHFGVTWGVYLCAGKPPLADNILSHPRDLTRCDSVIGLDIPAMSGHIQYRGAASGVLNIRISGINRVLLS